MAQSLATTALKGGSYTSAYNANPLLGISNTQAGFNQAGVGATSVGGTGGGVDPLALQGSVNDLLGFQGEAASYTAAAEGSALTAEGAAAEADAYRVAGGIADENQRTEALAEGVREYQIGTQTNQTVGAQKAAVAANGFAAGGSSTDILSSTYRQGYLSQQISNMQSAQVQRGYMEESAASSGEMQAATIRGQAATSLGAAQTAAATAATANETALSGALTQLVSGDPNAQQLITDLTAGNTSGAAADALLYNPNGQDQPLVTASPQPAPYQEPKSGSSNPSNIMSIWGI